MTQWLSHALDFCSRDCRHQLVKKFRDHFGRLSISPCLLQRCSQLVLLPSRVIHTTLATLEVVLLLRRPLLRLYRIRTDRLNTAISKQPTMLRHTPSTTTAQGLLQ